MELQQYLNRLEIPASKPASREWLDFLHDRHLIQVPFENLDIVAGREIVLDEDGILDKVVARRRGGFCYELNTAFAWLLRSSGFEGVTVLSAEVLGEDGEFGIPFDHMVLELAVDGVALLADVGFGDGFTRPLELDSEDEVRQRGVMWRLHRDGEHLHAQRFDRKAAEFRTVYRFTREPRRLEDFEAACRFHQTSAQSPFTRGPLCTAAIPDGRATLHRDRFVMQHGPTTREEPVADEEAWRKALQRYFSLTP